MMPQVVVYTREGCHLCDEAISLLRREGLAPTLVDVDVDGDEELLGRFSDCVPVVMIDGHIRFRGRVNEVLLRRLVKKIAHGGSAAPEEDQPDWPR